MKDEKEFVVENRKVGKTFTIKGKSLKDALKIEMLDPEKWLLVADPEISKPPEEAQCDGAHLAIALTMGKLASMVSQAVIGGFRGKIDFYLYMGVPCFRKWPKSPGKLRAPAVMAGWAPFTNAVHLWNQLSPYIRRQYEEMAGDSGLSGRDMFMRSYLKGLYRNPTP